MVRSSEQKEASSEWPSEVIVVPFLAQMTINRHRQERDPAGGHPGMTEPEVGVQEIELVGLGSVLNVHPTELVAEVHAGWERKRFVKSHFKDVLLGSEQNAADIYQDGEDLKKSRSGKGWVRRMVEFCVLRRLMCLSTSKQSVLQQAAGLGRLTVKPRASRQRRKDQPLWLRPSPQGERMQSSERDGNREAVGTNRTKREWQDGKQVQHLLKDQRNRQ